MACASRRGEAKPTRKAGLSKDPLPRQWSGASRGGTLPSPVRRCCWGKLLALGILAPAILGGGGGAYAQGSTSATTSVTLRGESSGGVLTLMMAPELNYPYAAVTNQVGEGAPSVISQLAAALRGCDACTKSYGGNPVSTSAETLVLQAGHTWSGGCTTWIIGGTERGFSIPMAPSALSACLASNQVTLEWVNPPGGYDSIAVVVGGSGWASLRGNSTRVVQSRASSQDPNFPSEDITYVLVGCKDGTPSNGTGVRLRNRVRQESLMNVPFTQGIAPGFRSWQHTAPQGTFHLEQGDLPSMAPSTDPWRFLGKGFYQVVRGNGTFRGGVARSFLGLTPGHTYRASARMNTLESKEGAWSWSFHAAANASGRNSLTPEQMSGAAESPDHAKGPTAGQIARYDSATASKGEWVPGSSGADGPGKSVGDITLPQGCDSITLWWRLEGTNVVNIACGVDSVALEDLGKR